jgi:hypothetical protein
MMPEKEPQRRRASPRQRAAGAGNLKRWLEANKTPPAMKHGVCALLSTGRVPEGREAVIEHVDSVIGAMVSDLGGSGDVSAQMQAILASQRVCLLVLALADGYLRAEGLIGARGRPHPLLATVVSFSNTVRLNALALGLERKPRRVGEPQNLDEYIDSRVAEKESVEGAEQQQ